MANSRLSMRKIAEVLRLYHQAGAQPPRDSALGRGVAHDGRRVFAPGEAGRVGLAAAGGADHDQPEAPLFPPTSPATVVRAGAGLGRRASPSCGAQGVTLDLLWQEYQAAHPDGLPVQPVLRALPALGAVTCGSRCARPMPRASKLFVDYAGQTVAVIDAATGEVRQAQIFVAVLGASNYTYAEATWTQQACRTGSAPTCARSTSSAACPQLSCRTISRAASPTACRYEPELNPTYQDLATHYGMAVHAGAGAQAARQGQGRGRRAAGRALDSGAAAPPALLQPRRTQRRHRRAADAPQRPAVQEAARLAAQRLRGLDRPALRPLPAQPYEYAEWKLVRVGIDYHVEVDGHYYSVPYRLTREQVDVRLTATTVELFHQRPSASPATRQRRPGGTPPSPAHMPRPTSAVAGWNAERFTRLGGQRSARTPRPSSASCTGAAIRSRVTALPRHPALRPRSTATTAWKPPARGPSQIGARPIAAFDSMLQERPGPQPRQPDPGHPAVAPRQSARPRLLPLSRSRHAEPSHPRQTLPPAPVRHGPALAEQAQTHARSTA